MDWSAPHAGFTLTAYLVSAAALLGLSLVLILRGRRLRKRAGGQAAEVLMHKRP